MTDPGPIRLTRRQGHPGHRRSGRADHDAHAHRRAGEGDQRGGEDRTRHPRPGRPDPAVTPQHPAAIVKRREAPGCLVHPGPAPAGVPNPAAVLERGPSGADHQRRPHHAELGVALPATVTVQVFRTCHFRRHIAHRGAAVVMLLIGPHPFSKAVLHGGRPGDQRAPLTALGRQLHTLPSGQIKGLIDRLHLQCTSPDGGPGGVVLAVHAVGSSALRLQPRLGRQDLQFRGDLA